MATSKDTLILGEYKITDNLSTKPTIFEEKWDIAKFKKRCRVVIVRWKDDEIEFDLIGIHHALVNTFRRLILREVATMAIEKVYVANNTTVIQDEVLAHRMGLIPLKADPRKFEMKESSSMEDENEYEMLKFELKIKCSRKDNNRDSLKVEDMYKNSSVYSKSITWKPIGKQAERFKEEDVAPIYPDILINKLRPGQELDLKMVAVKGIGSDHAKFSPVSAAFYRLLPEIRLTRQVEGEEAKLLQSCFSPGVIGIRNKSGKQVAYVQDARYDTCSRNVFMHDEIKDAVIMSKVRDHFIFTIETVGALKPDEIFIESIKCLRKKCLEALQVLSQV